ncbi:MAG TPA: M2 family metallopeptidase [Planctomycetota bacterium]|jgi:peptidyl-dipeptidase A|nr:M2 family metallopeptidase [Planctomycetota bacterium]OQC21083.1 MAG: Peptidase family M3 [Planctomycetes bacterium ADurb.Bin069]NMD34757.1 M2 family metallopeptidase [Planctomycetota bacterium]HNS00169.1 M2 family metallopeptidase [Planctomycetota bacterium]HNU26702.1 M2 family metallopeptidase [Planctomycetota bacterium]
MTGLSRALRVAFIAGLASCGGSERRAVEDAAAPAAVQAEAVQFIAWHESVVKPLEKAIAEAWWNANTSGRDADFKAKEAAENELDAVLADRARARRLEKIHDDIAAAGGRIDPLVARQIELLRLQYLEKQLDPELLKRLAAKANAIEQVFNVYRAKVDGKELTDSQVRKILKESRDPAERKAVWEAGKAVGAAVQADLRELVRLRNEAARALGFQDYHRMQLTLGEQDPEQVLALFDELHDLTREPFAVAKNHIDAQLARAYGITVSGLRPWHYQDPFFQEPQAVFPADLDSAYAGADILRLCREFYAGIGLPVDAVLARSDLREKPGKSPHAFCTDIDREGDVRVLANVVPNHYWMGTMLHELGHAVYSSLNIPAEVPYILRTDAHALCTEAVAMLFERFAARGDWLEAMGVAVKDRGAFDEAGALARRHHLLIFAAWSQVMFRFEKSMYADPGQDLNKLWWDLVEKYQLVRRPEGRDAPDYAAKIHIVSAPAYYHNYLMGELFACQLNAAIAREVLGVPPARALYNGNPKVGAFLKARVFAPGRTVRWTELVRAATGEPLNARAFAAEFKGR